jgi:predicted nuclease of predicted toxin-antitoxin system
VRFLIDRCAGRGIADWLREEGHDVVESRERGPDPGDRAILQWAVSEERILVTMDKDFGEFVFLERAPHWGIVRLPDVPVETRVELMDRVLQRHAGDLAARAIVTIRGGRIRISTPASG